MHADQHFDLIVVGGTPAGIIAAIRSAREGLRVLLVNASGHLGGLITSGIGVMDTLYHGSRSPILDEFINEIKYYYETHYGADSKQYDICCGSGKIKFEPHVGERILMKLLTAEREITILYDHYPQSVERAQRQIVSITLHSIKTSTLLKMRGASFIDATYEGDLAAVSGVPFRVGRESRSEYGEIHAGKIFTTHGYGQFPREAVAGRLNLSTFPVISQEIFAGSTGEGDQAIQAYTFRVCLSSDPNNRRYPDKPLHYDRSTYLGIIEDHHHSLGIPYALKSQLLLDDVQEHTISPVTSGMPNHKFSWNEPNLVGGNYTYPTDDWEHRHRIIQQHKDHALGLLYFLQNDEAVPQHVREDALQWGLALDEFMDNDNFPYEMYVREARRIVGRYVFTEHDASLQAGLDRTPVHADSIAIAEWPMDSHECTTDRQFASLGDGKFLLSEWTRPSQIPYRSMLSHEYDNLLIPVCLSCTHVGWGTIRLEPTWMHLGEVAAYAVLLAAKEDTMPGTLVVTQLQRILVDNGVMISFFNDFDMNTPNQWVPAIQYWATQGFFRSYDAYPDNILSKDEAQIWIRIAFEAMTACIDADVNARLIPSKPSNDQLSANDFWNMIKSEWEYRTWPRMPSIEALRFSQADDKPLKRGDACYILYQLMKEIDSHDTNDHEK